VGAAARRQHLEGRVLVLVDDVMTTAATLDACARVLKQAGAREVRALTLARALPRSPRLGRTP
jgi:predicted amidophosphoribosyltransferase